MTSIRDMQLLAALARHEHFARAAEECGISQPAFSARIRNLEHEFGAPIVKRGNRFAGFTREGEIALKWARQLLANADFMRQEIEDAREALSGSLSIGTIPTALTFAADIPAVLAESYPGLMIRIISGTSSQILRGIEDFSLDAGITYLDKDIPGSVASYPLYEERYVLLAPPKIAPRLEGTATWAEAAALPLCLLSRDMRNRRIIDEIFSSVGKSPKPAMETNAFTAALTQVARETAATIAPERLADNLPIASGAVRLRLTEPDVRQPIGLIVADRDLLPPAVGALMGALNVAAR